MKLLIKGGRIIDPLTGLDFIGDLLIENGRIAGLERNIDKPEGAQEINAAGLVVCPGFIDLHCHLRDPDPEDKETIATGTQAAARGGFTTLCAMPNTRPAMDSPEVIGLVMRKARDEGSAKVLPIGAATVGRDGYAMTDMEALAQVGVIGFSDDGSPVWNDNIMEEALVRSMALGLPIMNHCEDLSISHGGVMNDGLIARGLGLQGVPALAEESMVLRDIKLAEATGGHLHITHISTAGSVEILRRAKERGLRVTAEATPHHLTITEEWAIPGRARGGRPTAITPGMYNTAAKVNPPLRSVSDVEAVVQALIDGVIDCIATDHAPHTQGDKECSFDEAAFGISGLEVALGSLMSLVHSGRLDMPNLIERLTAAPARILGLPDRFPGSLRVGSPADVTIFDPQSEWVVNSADFVSKGKNTPLDGATLRGRVRATIVDGSIAYRDEELNIV